MRCWAPLLGRTCRSYNSHVQHVFIVGFQGCLGLLLKTFGPPRSSPSWPKLGHIVWILLEEHWVGLLGPCSMTWVFFFRPLGCLSEPFWGGFGPVSLLDSSLGLESCPFQRWWCGRDFKRLWYSRNLTPCMIRYLNNLTHFPYLVLYPPKMECKHKIIKKINKKKKDAIAYSISQSQLVGLIRLQKLPSLKNLKSSLKELVKTIIKQSKSFNFSNSRSCVYILGSKALTLAFILLFYWEWD